MNLTSFEVKSCLLVSGIHEHLKSQQDWHLNRENVKSNRASISTIFTIIAETKKNVRLRIAGLVEGRTNRWTGTPFHSFVDAKKIDVDGQRKCGK